MKDVYLFSGFLGSGKTSMLTDVIRQLKEKNLKPAVIMNELGKLPFDSHAVEKDIPLKEMLEGCICCSGAEKTEAQIQSLLMDNEFDVLIIETTGAAHPVEALDAVYSPLFAEKLNVKGIVTVADSKLWLNRETLTPQVRSLFMEQIRHAHLLLANKTDLLTEAEQARVVYELQGYNPHAFILQTTNGRVPLRLLEDLKATAQVDKSDILKSPIAAMHLGSRLVEFKGIDFTQQQFEDWVRSLPDTIYRMKGYVPIEGVRNPMLFQYAYGMVQWLPEYVKMPAKLVIIGENVGDVNIIGIH
ncbi:CobW family GTP-binding protein [Lysinibacillus pakistanensis]|uniref:GTP-binding protein n=1 Tax=Lysinibacillus pakistanensis TaxID=759811 RepID=A0AAX3X329_9BACI|nr:CobW family GTP-binding protein [Lysinibacillus pakistanensis]MDM5233597.1 GTP-binding protein [Lysinibacillus pakistanensis]WHY49061.1 GTP-binding protein [Lysinibacillus pakistanensis]WHY54074.1 GTP-binding protein [Lysinibacillus pakistanensis]